MQECNPGRRACADRGGAAGAGRRARGSPRQQRPESTHLAPWGTATKLPIGSGLIARDRGQAVICLGTVVVESLEQGIADSNLRLVLFVQEPETSRGHISVCSKLQI